MEQRQEESGFRFQQRALDEAAGEFAMQLPENNIAAKPLERISIPILRDYLAVEFADCLSPEKLPFRPSLERLIDDIVFLCFFVGNDFLPHLPSLDIRDGALDYLFNVYKSVLPSLGDYITKSGGNVHLPSVSVIFEQVGAIEDYVFAMKHDNEQRMKAQEQQQQQRPNNKNGAPPPPVPFEGDASATRSAVVRGRAAKILEKNAYGHGKNHPNSKTTSNSNGGGGFRALERGFAAKERSRQQARATAATVASAAGKVVQSSSDPDNWQVAQALKQALQQQQQHEEAATTTASATIEEEGGEPTQENTAPAQLETDVLSAGQVGGKSNKRKNNPKQGIVVENDNNDSEIYSVDDAGQSSLPQQAKRSRVPKRDKTDASIAASVVDGDTNTTAAIANDIEMPEMVGIVGEAAEEFDNGEGDDDEDDDDVEDEDDPDAIVNAQVERLAKAAADAAALKEKVKAAQQRKLDEYAKNVKDNVRLHEKGWKDRYYSDKCKADDVEAHGGREHLFRSYVVGLCWVMKYYYDGCPSWKWYFPFHYGT